MSEATLRELVLGADETDYFGSEGPVPAAFEDGSNHRILLIIRWSGTIRRRT